MSTLQLLDETDLDWLASAIDTVVAAAGQPWRIALDRLDDTRRSVQPVAPRRFSAVVGAIQRILGGRARNAKLARLTRSHALGRPAFTPAAREARVAATAARLGLTSAAVESLLWADLPRERAVELPAGRPSELEVAAFANITLLQRSLARAHAVTIRIWGDSGPLIRAAASRGLLATASVGIDREIVLDIVGPLALCHRTSVYGRALAQLVPLLSDCERFELDVRVEMPPHEYRIACVSPALLPPLPARSAATSYAVLRLARDLGRRRPDLSITTSPTPVIAGTTLVCPDLAIGDLHIEVVGFWTREHIQRKLERYEAADLDVRLCIDLARSCADDDPPSDRRLVYFTKHVDASGIIDAGAG